jgi:transposase InsO family protein
LYLSSANPQFFSLDLEFSTKLKKQHRIIDSDADEVLNREIFYNIKEAKVVIEKWRKEYNTVRPHCSLGYRP